MEGQSGNVYQIREDGLTIVFRNGHEIAKACLQLTTPAPSCDRMIAEYLLLKNDEPRYWQTAHFLYSSTTAWGKP